MTLAVYAPRVAAHPTRTGARRDVGAIRLLVVHTSEGGELSTSAEGLALFISTPRTPGNLASYHYIADYERVIPIVPDDFVAYANAGANHDGLSICHPGKAGQTSAQWADDASSAQLEQVARWLADKADEYDLPLVKVDAAAIVRGASGVCGHADVSKAYKRSTHTDPGPNYPWDPVLARARQLATPPDPIPDLPDPAEEASVLQALVRFRGHAAVYAVYSGGYKRWIPDGSALDATVGLAALAGRTLTVQDFSDDGTFRAFGSIEGPVPSGVDAWGVPG